MKRFPPAFRLRPGGLLLALSGLVLAGHAFRLGLGDASLPGPGFWAACVGAGMILAGLSFCFGSSSSRQREAPPLSPAGLKPLAGFAAACLGWMVLLSLAGWMPATVFAVFVAAWSAGNSPGRSAALAAGVVLLFSLIFAWVMPHSLPGGNLFSPGVSL